jgi:hypothetical protein
MSLQVTEEGQKVSEQLWQQPQKDNKEMAYLAAVDIIDEQYHVDAYSLANQLPFVHGHEAKASAVRKWIADGWLEGS